MKVALTILVTGALSAGTAAADTYASDEPRASMKQSSLLTAEDSEGIIANWPNRPKLGARELISKYGPPQEATSERLVWHDKGAFKRIEVMRSETEHDFPKPHTDFMKHTVRYDVPADRMDELTAFDGSVTANRTEGELSAKCDQEGHNILSLNLANDVATGRKSASDARSDFSEIVMAEMRGENPAYVDRLQFQPAGGQASFADAPVIPGSPMRAVLSENRIEGPDAKEAEILAKIAAIDENEVAAASVAEKKNIGPQVKAYAKMLHEDHGKNQEETLALGEKIDLTPIETEAVDAIRVKGAGELADLVPLDGARFESAFLGAMIKGHTDVLSRIDNEFLKASLNDDLRKHIETIREKVASHLEQAKDLQTNALTKSNAPRA